MRKLSEFSRTAWRRRFGGIQQHQGLSGAIVWTKKRGESSAAQRSQSGFARFFAGTRGSLLTKQISHEPNEWECLVRPGRKIGVGERIFFGVNRELTAEIIGRDDFGERNEFVLRRSQTFFK